MTTLELAEAMANAVIKAHLGYQEDAETEAIQAVLTTLRDHQSWFCRVTYDEHGDDIGETIYEQQELFA